MLKTFIQWGIDLFYPVFKRVLPFRLYAYLAVGAINTVLNIVLFAVFYQFILPRAGFVINGIPVAAYTVSLLLAFALTVPTGFWLAKHFAFKQEEDTDEQTARKLGKYVLVVLQGLGSDYLIMKGLIVFLNMQPTIAKIISTVIVLTANYLLQKYFTFGVRKVSQV